MDKEVFIMRDMVEENLGTYQTTVQNCLVVLLERILVCGARASVSVYLDMIYG